MGDSFPPRDGRRNVIIRAAVHLPSGKQVERRVRNLSAFGACLDNESDMTTGDELQLDMGR